MGGMAPTSDDTSRHLLKLGTLVLQRRTALGITDKRDAAKLCSLSVTTYSNVEKGKSVGPTSYAKLEAGFGMQPGSCTSVLAGADSITLTDGTELISGAQIQRSRVRAADVSEEMREGFLDVATAVSPQVPLGEAQEMSRRVAEYALEVMRKHGLLSDSD
jgi:transcriptional regulator with XRE-family HTH domain